LIHTLRLGSADAVYWLFHVAGVPVLRQGLVFTANGASVEVTGDCSGINAFLDLLICSILAGHLYLRSPWKKFFLVAIVLPLAILKNGLRIFVLTSLAGYVDPDVLDGPLHRYGGIPLFFLALLAMFLIVQLLQSVGLERQLHGRTNGVITHV